ncbi:DoxX family protein [Amycolatopsis nigrescens]|uniref:DoxX family protein n=1 Tax=Amycolatopsis nigrescens TaxID=381445 RepID=UPI000381B405|nr:DoxX family protein [Amycolatopsis nigrescens]
MILRRLARPLLAATFVSGGIETLRHPETRVKMAQPFLEKTVERHADKLPDGVPTDPQTLVRINGAVMVGAGTALALGKAPRLASLLLFGSLVPTTLAGHAYWEKQDPDERAQHRVHFLKNAAIGGGLLISAADTHGKPSLNWRAKRAAGEVGKKADKIAGKADKAAKKAKKKGKQALPK